MKHSVSKHSRKNVAEQKKGGFFLLYLFLIALAALALRLGVCWELASINQGHNSVFTPSKLSDLATYMQLGRDMATGQYQGEFYYQPFYYAVFLPIIYYFSGGAIWAVILIQSLLGAASCYLAGLCGAMLFGKKGGISAAILTAISTPLLLYTPFHQNETLQTFNLIALFYLTLCACRKNTIFLWSTVGLVTGISILTRGNIWILLPGILAVWGLTGIRKHASWKKSLLSGTCLLGLLIAVQLPFAIHNTRIRKQLTGPSTAADAVLALGNSKEAPPGGRNPGLPAGPMEYPEAYHQIMNSGTSTFCAMTDWLKEEPAAFLELQCRKLLLFWNCEEIPNNVSLYGEGSFSNILSFLLLGRSGILIALGLAGLFAFTLRTIKRRSLQLALLYYFIIAYWCAVSLFYILSRFRAPIMPLLAVAGGGFIALAIRRLRNRANLELWRSYLMLCLTVLVGGMWITFSSYNYYREYLEAPLMRLVRPNGTMITGCNFDHGPFSFGGWEQSKLKPGTILTKKFVKVPAEGELSLKVLASEAGTIKLRINGKEWSEHFAPGLQDWKIPVKLLDGELCIDIQEASPDFYFIYDAQRNYGRSTLNGELLPGEWVMRFYHNTKGAK